jgi:hypothetical protein
VLLAKCAARIGEPPFGLPSVHPHADHSTIPSLPMPSREDILNSQGVENHGATSGFTYSYHDRPPSPVMDDPGAELDRELGTRMRR